MNIYEFQISYVVSLHSCQVICKLPIKIVDMATQSYVDLPVKKI